MVRKCVVRAGPVLEEELAVVVITSVTRTMKPPVISDNYVGTAEGGRFEYHDDHIIGYTRQSLLLGHL